MEGRGRAGGGSMECPHPPGAWPAQHLHVLIDPEAPQPVLLGLMETSLHGPDWLTRWPVVIPSTSRPSPLPRGQGVWLEAPPL